jgi:hypothetical protein
MPDTGNPSLPGERGILMDDLLYANAGLTVVELRRLEAMITLPPRHGKGIHPWHSDCTPMLYRVVKPRREIAR